MSFNITEPIDSETAAAKANKDGTGLTNLISGWLASLLPTNTDRAAWLIALNAPPLYTSANISAAKTIVETPVEIFAGVSLLAGRTWLAIRNESTDTRIRFGRLTANLQRDGEIIEPGAFVLIQFLPGVTTAIYASSEGAAIKAHITEDV